ncbi:hypothetical protein QBC45DRAFT_222247 [Copromyces sp. CBS 386.78]|nr:hypothetical protein QBC45DRAFT_222247 [Copromyces sp. CBS 386.78]
MDRQARPALRVDTSVQHALHRSPIESPTSDPPTWLSDPIYSEYIRQPLPADDGSRAPPSPSPYDSLNGLLPAQPEHIDMVISIRPGERRDFPHLLKVQTASMQNLRTSVDLGTWLRWHDGHRTYEREHLEGAYRKRTLWVAIAKLASGEKWIVGVATGGPADNWSQENCRDNVLYISIYTHVSVRRMGVGSQLLKQVDQDIRERGFDYMVASAFMEEPWKEPEEKFLKKNDFQRMNVLGWHRRSPLRCTWAVLQLLNRHYSEIQPGMQRALWIKVLPPKPGVIRHSDYVALFQESSPESYEWQSGRRPWLRD